MVEPLFPAESPATTRRPLLGYAMVWTAATLFAVNGTVAKVTLDSGLSSLELTQVRSTGAFLGLGLLLLAFAPGKLRVRAAELPYLVLFGVSGLAAVQWLYFVAIHRLPIGIALLIQYLAPLLVALWARFVVHTHVRRRVWVALVLALSGLALVVEVWAGLTLDGVGVVAALLAAVAFAVNLLLAERAVGRRDPISLTFYGFLFAALLWTVVQPPWRFPIGVLDSDVSLLGNLSNVELTVAALVSWIVLLGTIAPFTLIVGALRHIPATRVAVVATLEPVLATVVAYAWLGEELAGAQLAGGAAVLAGIVLAQTAR